MCVCVFFFFCGEAVLGLSRFEGPGKLLFSGRGGFFGWRFYRLGFVLVLRRIGVYWHVSSKDFSGGS